MNVKDIVQLPELAGLRARETLPPAGGGEAHPFAAVLKSSLDEVNQLQHKADEAITALRTGDKMSLHDTMIAMEQADVSFRLMMQVRNKIVDAYQEIMRIQV